MHRFSYPPSVLRKLPQPQLVRRLLQWGKIIEEVADSEMEQACEPFLKALSLLSERDPLLKNRLGKIESHPGKLKWKHQERMSLLERFLERRVHDWELLPEWETKRPAKEKKSNVALILDRLRSVMNVGSIFRTAEGMGVSEIALTGHTPKPDSQKGHKAAMGSEHYLKWKTFDHWQDAFCFYRKSGYQICGLESSSKAELLSKLHLDYPLALVFGNERHGLEADCQAACDRLARFPMLGIKSSYNVAVCAGMALYELRREPHL